MYSDYFNNDGKLTDIKVQKGRTFDMKVLVVGDEFWANSYSHSVKVQRIFEDLPNCVMYTFGGVEGVDMLVRRTAKQFPLVALEEQLVLMERARDAACAMSQEPEFVAINELFAKEDFKTNPIEKVFVFTSWLQHCQIALCAIDKFKSLSRYNIEVIV